MTYIGIEGSSYVGKTTTIDKLRDRGYSIIPEYDQFGPFPESDNSFDGLCTVVEQLINLERRRTTLLGSFAIRGNVFSDRTPISFLTFEDMKSFTAKTVGQQVIHSKTKDYAKTRLVSEISKGNIVLPDGIAVMELSAKSNFEGRVAERGMMSVQELARFDIQKYIVNRTVAYAGELIGSSKTTLLQVDGADTEELADDMIAFAGKVSKEIKAEARE
jgi:hypothetical protein